MLAGHVTRETLEAAAAEVGVVAEIDTQNKAGTRHRVKLYPNVTPDMRTPSGRRRRLHGESMRARYQRRSASGFRDGIVNAVCWHGFRDYFRAVYRREPEAVFRTAYATYRGRQGFEATFPETGDRNIGSAFNPVLAREACYCGEGVAYTKASLGEDGSISFGTVAMIYPKRCPHYILVPEHYNADGSCKCGDPAASEMIEWGYTWKQGAWR